MKWVIIAIVVLCIIGAASSGSSDKNATQTASNSNSKSDTIKENDAKEAVAEPKETETQKEIEYISVTATELSDALNNNAMKAQNDYKGQYLEITGKLGIIDSSGKYIGIDSDKDFDLTNIQCYIHSDEQKQTIMEMSRGNAITVKGYCKDIGELLGYQIDIEEVLPQ